jgi:alkylhydroperoxidase family enzyme
MVKRLCHYAGCIDPGRRRRNTLPMAYVRKIDPKDADGILRRVFNARMKAAGRLWEIVAVQSLNAESLRDCMRVYGQIMYGDSHLTREEREMIAVVTSQVNECHY